MSINILSLYNKLFTSLPADEQQQFMSIVKSVIDTYMQICNNKRKIHFFDEETSEEKESKQTVDMITRFFLAQCRRFWKPELGEFGQIYFVDFDSVRKRERFVNFI